MESIKPFSNLDDNTFNALLAEIADADDALNELSTEGSEKIIALDIQDAFSEVPENAEIEAYYGDRAWQKQFINSYRNDAKIELLSPEDKANIEERRKNIIAKKVSTLKQDKLSIQREAFNQNIIELGQEIDKKYIKMLITELVQTHTYLIDKYANYINTRLTMLLAPHIPKRLRNCMADFPNSVKMCPGFLYRASEDYGQGLTFWATPNIPYYFEQGTEQKTLIENCPKFLYSVDKAVSFYHTHEAKRQTKEFRYATIMINKKIVTYFDLLKLNPFWFKTLYNKLTEKK